jgi:hypothetical protein
MDKLRDFNSNVQSSPEITIIEDNHRNVDLMREAENLQQQISRNLYGTAAYQSP